MTNKPIQITSILFDYLAAVATFIVAAFFTAFIVLFFTKLPEDHWRNATCILPLFWSVFFYLMRRRFNFRITCVQIIITATITSVTGYISFTLFERFTDLIGDAVIYSVLFLLLTLFIFTKHASDKYILNKHETP